MTAVHPHRRADATNVTVYWFDEQRRLHRDEARRRSHFDAPIEELFPDHAGASVHPICDDDGQVVGIATRTS